MPLDLSVDKLLEMRGKPVYDRAGEKIGSIEDIYVDDETREPEWLGLGTGFLGMKHAIVPLIVLWPWGPRRGADRRTASDRKRCHERSLA